MTSCSLNLLASPRLVVILLGRITLGPLSCHIIYKQARLRKRTKALRHACALFWLEPTRSAVTTGHS